MTDPDIRRALQHLRDHDAPADVDRDALLQKILAAAPAAPTAPVTSPARSLRTPALVGTAALVAALAWRALRPVPTPAAPPAAPVNAPANLAVNAPVTVPVNPVVNAPVNPMVNAPVNAPASPRATAPANPVVNAPANAPANARTARPATPPLDDEWTLLREADVALQGHEPERALRILARHTVQHPRGVAGPEVLAYRVRAYCMAGRTDEARATAVELQARAPESPAAYSLRSTCVTLRSSPSP